MKKRIIIAFIILMLISALIFAHGRLSILVRNAGMKGLSGIISTEADISSVDVNLLKGKIHFTDLSIRNPAGFKEPYFVRIPDGYIDISLKELLFKRIDIEEIFLYHPQFNIEIRADSASNTSLIFKKSRSKEMKADSDETKGKMYLGIRQIAVSDGVYQLVNYKVNDKGAAVVFDSINLKVENLTEPKEEGKMPTVFQCSARLAGANPSGTVGIEGKGGFLIKAIDFDMDLKARDISLAYFMPFFEASAPILSTGGSFDMEARATCRKDKLYSLQSVRINNLQVASNASGASDNIVFGLPKNTVIKFFINSQGALDFEFEVTGTMSDPQFHIAEALKKVLARSIGKAIVNRLSGAVRGTIDGTVDVKEAGKKALQDIFKQMLPNGNGRNEQQPQDSGSF